MSKIICDFCGATDTRDNPVIAGDNACICKACVTAANEIMNGNYTNGGFLSSLDADEIKELFGVPITDISVDFDDNFYRIAVKTPFGIKKEDA